MTLHVSNLSSDPQEELRTRDPVRHGIYVRYLKRPLDVMLVLLALPVVLPLILVLALLVAATGTRPFYAQQRVGRGGVPFRMWKLRTMVHNADTALEAYLAKNPDARAEWNATQKLRNDPRITPLGKLLRKTSIDELPQLFNVLNGTMSLVGPRPMMVHQQPFYVGHAYFELRPGITGSWQVSGRNDCIFAQRAAFDDHYGRLISLREDLDILCRTFGVVCRATGH